MCLYMVKSNFGLMTNDFNWFATSDAEFVVIPHFKPATLVLANKYYVCLPWSPRQSIEAWLLRVEFVDQTRLKLSQIFKDEFTIGVDQCHRLLTLKSEALCFTVTERQKSSDVVFLWRTRFRRERVAIRLWKFRIAFFLRNSFIDCQLILHLGLSNDRCWLVVVEEVSK